MQSSQVSLFEQASPSGAIVNDTQPAYQPLAARMRARELAEIVGQPHIIGEGALLPRLIQSNQFGSLLFYGPPGCGKTTLAEVIAATTKSRFFRINAVLSNVAELRDVLRLARHYPNERPVVFIDEIHRFNKAQQDLLLPDVEAGHIRLIGATTHNPSFYLIPPLLSRSHLFRLKPVAPSAIEGVLKEALITPDRGLGHLRCKVEDGVLAFVANMADGDLRRALNALETLVLSIPLGSTLTKENLKQFAKERNIPYDRDEDEHYNTISAFIKSMRGCDPDAALYWLAKMLAGGEDPRFIARRLVIFASEDVGLADSRALPLAVATFEACEYVGLPECELNLAHAVVFLATAPKSNTAYLALRNAQKAIAEKTVQAVPLWLRDSNGSVSKKLGNGAAYLYSHDYPEAISGQEYLISPEKFYTPKAVGAEIAITQRLEYWKQLKAGLS